MCIGAQEVNNINEITSIIATETAVILRFIFPLIFQNLLKIKNTQKYSWDIKTSKPSIIR